MEQNPLVTSIVFRNEIITIVIYQVLQTRQNKISRKWSKEDYKKVLNALFYTINEPSEGNANQLTDNILLERI